MKNHLLRTIFKKKVYICEAKNEKLAATRYFPDDLDKLSGGTQIRIYLS